MEIMPPGNSFPQICVVSVNESVDKLTYTQEHGRTVAISNVAVYFLGNKRVEFSGRRLSACGCG